MSEIDGPGLIVGDGDHDPHFDPIISLPEVKVPTLEEEESVLYKVRAKLFRHDKDQKEWKERGTGEAKLLFHEKNSTVRVLMRRDKTLKLCANHYDYYYPASNGSEQAYFNGNNMRLMNCILLVTPDMALKPNCGSDRAWVWSTQGDASDGSPKSEILAMRFMNADAAKKWKEKFEEAKCLVQSKKVDDEKNDDDVEKTEEVSTSPSISEDEDEDVLDKVRSLNITEEADTDTELKNNVIGNNCDRH